MTAENNELICRSNVYYREGSLDNERWSKIAELPDYDSIIDTFDWTGILNAHCGKRNVTILDCGCGTGHFPQRLLDKVTFPSGTLFDYDTVDVSPYSLTEHRKGLQHPFNPRNSFNVPIEEFQPLSWAGDYEIIWCMHSLYTVPRARLPRLIATLEQLLAPNGKCFIYLPKKQSAYMKLFDLYLAELDNGQIEPYLTAEEVLAVLSARGSRPLEIVDCGFNHWIEESEPQTLETYLNQICLHPDPLTLPEWRKNAAFDRYLDESFDSQRHAWRFRQELSLISFLYRNTRGGKVKRIALWAIPRAVGTAFERVFVERNDTLVAHELFMPCHYYSSARASDRYDGVVEPAPEYDYQRVKQGVEQLTGKPILFLKEIAFHMKGIIEEDFLSSFTHTFIIRDPRISIPSLYKLMPDASFEETGFAGIKEIFDLTTRVLRQVPVVVNGESFRRDPVGTLRAYCEHVEIPFVDTTTWKNKKVLPEWQMWEDWHEQALTSSGVFEPPDREQPAELPAHVMEMIEAATPYYREMNRFAIKAISRAG